jgi:hypothetical protein
MAAVQQWSASFVTFAPAEGRENVIARAGSDRLSAERRTVRR